MTPSRAAAAPAISMPLLREASFRDYDAIAALEQANGLRSRSREEWSRMWTGNPAYQSLGAKFPIGWVLEEENARIVGTLSNVPLLYTLNGRRILAATGRGWAVEPAYRAFAPLLFDGYFHQNVDVLLSTSVNGDAEASHTFHEARVPVGDWTQAAFRIIDYRGFAEAAWKLKNLPPNLSGTLSPLAAAALRVKHLAGNTAPLPAAPPGVEVTCTGEFSPEFDGFWNDLQQAKSGKLLGVRTREVLAWHFGFYQRSGDLRILTAGGRGRSLGAYAVLVRRDHAASGLKRLRLADFQTLDASLNSTILRRAVDLCREDGVHVLELVGCGLPALRDWERIMPHRRALPAWCYFFHSNDESLMASLLDAEAWEPSTYDGDSSI